MSRPRLADLACCAGGAARGYHAAGFTVIGYDIEPQKNYPYNCWEQDVLKLDPRHMASMFDAFHASPSCKGYTALRTAHNAKDHAREIPLFVDWLNRTGKPWVLENVEEAMDEMFAIATDPKNKFKITILCGAMFGLGTQGFRLERHRLFMTNFWMPDHPVGHWHNPEVPVVGVYGGHARNRAKRFGGRTTKDAWVGGHKTAMAEALGIPVGAMTVDELSEAIPPAYTRWAGGHLMRHLNTLGAVRA